MIKRVGSDRELNSLLGSADFLSDKQDTEARKILALGICYGTKYDFCRFYKTDNSVLCGLSGSYILRGCADFEELAWFFSFAGFSDIFCSYGAGTELSKTLGCCRADVNLMRFDGIGSSCATEKEIPLEEFFAILKTGFDIEFEPWYLDISHRIRHNVTQIRRLGDSVLVIQHDLGGAALLSQIATLPESRGKGNAARLISSVCAELSPSEVYIICEDRLTDFYKHIGFEFVCKKCILTPSAVKPTEQDQCARLWQATRDISSESTDRLRYSYIQTGIYGGSYEQ